MYGELTLPEMHSRLRADFLPSSLGDEERKQWQELAAFLAHPYPRDGVHRDKDTVAPPVDLRAATHILRAVNSAT